MATCLKLVKSSKAQGLPLNLIILAIIAALVLILMVSFTVGGAATFFAKIFKGGIAAVGEDIETVKTSCQALCDRAQAITSTGAWKGTSYCAKTFNIDLDKDGKIGCPKDAKGKFDDRCVTDTTQNTKAQKEAGLKCWDSPTIDVSCQVQITLPTGEIKTCSPQLGAGTCVETDCT